MLLNSRCATRIVAALLLYSLYNIIAYNVFNNIYIEALGLRNIVVVCRSRSLCFRLLDQGVQEVDGTVEEDDREVGEAEEEVFTYI